MAAPPNPRIVPWFRLLKNIAHSHNLVLEFEVTLEATHHGPEINSPTMFVEIGSTEEYWNRQDAAQAIALLVWEGLGLGGRIGVGDRKRDNDRNKILLGIGGGHYVPRHMDIVQKERWCLGGPSAVWLFSVDGRSWRSKSTSESNGCWWNLERNNQSCI